MPSDVSEPVSTRVVVGAAVVQPVEADAGSGAEIGAEVGEAAPEYALAHGLAGELVEFDRLALDRTAVRERTDMVCLDVGV